MEEEDTRELLLPNWKGSGPMGLTLDKNEEGVFVKQLMQNSPAAKTGVVKEGDQIVGATVYFDNMSSEDIDKLLANVGHHTVGLKLQRKGDRSPLPGATFPHDVFSLKSPDVVLSGDDEEYKRIYTKKIKPRLKSDETLEPETQTRTITVTRKVTAYTVDVTGAKDSKEIDITSPEYKIKIPRHEISEISKTSVQTDEGKTVIKIPGVDMSSKTYQSAGEYNISLPSDCVSVHSTTVRYHEQSKGQFELPEGHTNTSAQTGSTSVGVGVPSVSVSAPSFEKTIDVKTSRFGPEHDIQFKGPSVAGGSSVDIDLISPAIKTSDSDFSAKVQTKDIPSVSSKIGFHSSGVKIKGPHFDTNKGGRIKIEETSPYEIMPAGIPRTDTGTGSVGMPFQMTKSFISPTIEGEEKNVTTDLSVPSGSVKEMKNNFENAVGKIEMQSFKMPKFGVSGTNEEKPEIKLSGAVFPTEIEGKAVVKSSGLDISGPQFSKADADLDVSEASLKDSGVNITMPRFKMPKFGIVESSSEGYTVDVNTAKKDIDIGGTGVALKEPGLKMESIKSNLPKVSVPDKNLSLQGPQVGEVKGPRFDIKGSKINVDIENPNINIKDSEGKMTMPTFKMPKFGVSQTSIEGQDVNASLSSGTVAFSGPNLENELNIKGKLKDSKINMPSLKADLPKVPVPEVDLSLKQTNVEGDFKDPKPEVHLPKMTTPEIDLNLKGLRPEGDIKGPSINVNVANVDLKAPELKQVSPDVDIDGKVKVPKFKKPEVNFPNVNMPNLDLSMKGPNWKGGADVSVLKLEGELEGPKVDMNVPDVDLKMKGPDVEGGEGKIKMPQFKMPKFGLSGHKAEGLDVDINLPKGDLDLSCPDADIEGPEGKIKGPKFKMPTLDVNLPKASMPDFNLAMKGPKMEGDIKGAKVDIKTPDMELEAPDLDIDGKVKGSKFKLPAVNLPTIDLNMKAPKWKGDMDLPQANLEAKVKAPKVDIKSTEFDVPSAELSADLPEGKIKSPRFKLPSWGFSKPNVSMPDIDLNLKGSKVKGDIDVSVPKGSGLKGPEIAVGLPEAEIDVPEAKGKKSKFRLPRFNFSSPKVQTPSADVKVSKADVDVSGPDIEIPSVEAKGKSPKFKIPSLSITSPKVSMPDVELNLKSPKVKGDMDVSIPKVEGGLQGDQFDIETADIELETPDVTLEGPEGKGKLKMPKFSLPKFGLSGTKPDGPDIDLKLQRAELDISDSSLNIETPNVNISGPECKVKGSKIKMPSANIDLPKVSIPDIDLKGPKIKGGAEVSASLKGPELNQPEIDINAPEVDIDGEAKSPKFKLPSMQLPKMSMPGIDLNLKGPKLEGGMKCPNVDIKGPKFGLSAPEGEGPDIDANLPKGSIDIHGPKVDMHTPDLNIEGPEGKIKGPKFDMPSLSIGLPKVSMTDVDLNYKGSKLEGDLKLPKANVKGPEADLEASGIDFDGKVKSSKFKLPSMHLPKMSVPGIDLNLKGPNLEGDVKCPDVDIKGPEVDIEASKISRDAQDVNLKGVEGKLYMPKLKFPKFGVSGPKMEGGFEASLPKGSIDISSPDIAIEPSDLSIKGPEGKLKGLTLEMPSITDVDLSLKGPKLGDLKGPKVDIKGPHVELKAPDMDIDSSKIKVPSMQLPKICMPDIGRNLKGPEVEGDVTCPAVDIKGPELDVKSPQIELDAPDINLKGPEGKLHMPKFKLPKFGVSGPKVEGPNIDASLPKDSIDISGPNVDIDHSGLDIKGPEGKLKGPKFEMPSINTGVPKVSLPNIDLNLKGPKVDGDFTGPKVDMKGPQVDLEAPDISSNFKLPSVQLSKGDIKCPKVDIKAPELDVDAAGIELKTPDVHVKSIEGKLKMPEFKLPSFGLHGTKMEAEDIEINLPKGKIDVSGPNIDIPGVDIQGPEVGLNRPKFTMPSADVSLPKVSVPGIKVKMPTVKGESDFSIPKLEGDLSLKSPNLKGDIDLSGPKLQSEIKGAGIVMSGPAVDIEGPEGNLKLSKIKKPKFGFGVKSPKTDLKSPSVDVTLPDVELDSEVPEVSVGGKGKKGKFKMPKIHMSGPKIKGKKGGFDVNTSELEGDINLNAPDIDLNVTGGDAAVNSSIGLKAPKTRKPLFGKISFPDVEFDIKSPKLKGETSLQSPSADINTPDVDISGGFKTPEAELTSPGLSLEASDIKAKKPKFKLPNFNMSGTKAEAPDANISVSLPKGDANLPGYKFATDVKAPSLDVNLGKISSKVPNVSAETSGTISVPAVDVNLKGPKLKGDMTTSETMELNAPKLDISGLGGKMKLPVVDISSPKVSESDIDIKLKGPNIKGDLDISSKLKTPTIDSQITLPQVDISGSHLQGPQFPKADMSVSGQEFSLSGKVKSAGSGTTDKFTVPTLEESLNVHGVSGSLESSTGKITFPRLLMPKFTSTGPELTGREMGVDVDFPSATAQVKKSGQADIEMEEGEIKIKKSKIKMPKLNFKSKGKGDASLPDVSGSKGDLKSSKASLGSAEGGLGSVSVDVEKSPKYEFSLFTSKKTRHRSSSLSEEKDESTHSSPSGTLEVDGSLSAEGGKKKGKHSKIKFGTFGGLGSKSKGSYEVTLTDDENVQESGVLQSKSRVSSSSSNDSAKKKE